MPNSEIVRRLDRLLTYHQKGYLTDEEFVGQLGVLITAENIGPLLERVPADLVKLQSAIVKPSD